MKKNEIIILLVSCVILAIIGTIFSPKNKIDKEYNQYGLSSAVSSKETFELEHSILYYYVGDKDTLKIKDYENNSIFTWYSSNDDIVSVDSEGNITCINEGKATIYVEKSQDDKSSCLIVVVDKNKSTKEEVKKEDYKKAKEESKTEIDEKPSEQTTPEKPVVPVSPTQPTIPPSPQEPTEPVVPTTPSVIEVESINVTETSKSLYTLDTYKINASVSPSNATNKTLTYKSSNEKLLSVDSSGNVKALMEGNAYVTITSNNNKFIKVNFNITSRERIHFISNLESTGEDYNTGDAILLESNGHYAMIDLGNTDDKIQNNIIKYLKDNNVTTLDFLLFTHMHSDHEGNFLKILENNIKVKNLWMKDYSDSFYTDETTIKRFNKVIKRVNNNSSLVGNIKYLNNEPEG